MPKNHESPGRPSPKGETTPLTRANINQRWAPLIALCAAKLMLVLSGRASTNFDEDNQYGFNPTTGYPFIGGRFDRPRP